MRLVKYCEWNKFGEGKKGVWEGIHKNSIKKGNARYILVRGKKLVGAMGKLHKKVFQVRNDIQKKREGMRKV